MNADSLAPLNDGSRAVACKPRGLIDRLRDELARTKDRVTELEAILAKADSQPGVADLVNDITRCSSNY